MITAQDASNILVFIDRALKSECGGIQEAQVAAQLQVKMSNVIELDKRPEKDTDEDGEDTTSTD